MPDDRNHGAPGAVLTGMPVNSRRTRILRPHILRPWGLPGVLLVLGMTMAACADAPGLATPGQTLDGPPARSLGPVATVPTQSMSPITGEVPAARLAEVVADAAERSGLDPSAIVTIRAESVTWPNGALGCPEPGVNYTQALVNGFHVVLRAGDQELDYRLTESGGFRLCEQGGRSGSSS